MFLSDICLEGGPAPGGGPALSSSLLLSLPSPLPYPPPQISLDDVAIIMKEMEVSRAAAELALRENKGSLEAALRALIDA